MATSNHSVVLNWTASPDGGTVNVYRGGTQIANGLTANTYTDSGVAVGSYTYYVTTTVNGAESGPSNQITVTVSPQPPSSLTAAAH